MSYPQQGYGAPPQGGYGAPPGGYGPPQGGYGYGQPGAYGHPPQPKAPADLGKIFGFSVLGVGSLIGLLYFVLVFLSKPAAQFLDGTVVAEFGAALVIAFGLAGKSAPKSQAVVAALSTAGALTGLVSVILANAVSEVVLDQTGYIFVIVVFIFALIQAGLAAAAVFLDKGEEGESVKAETPVSQTQASPYAGPQQPIAPQSYEQHHQHHAAPQQSYGQAQHGQQQAAAPSPYAQSAAPAPQVPATPPPAPASPYGIPAAGAGAQPPASAQQPPQINLGLGEPPRAH